MASDREGTRRKSALVVANRLPYPLDDGWKRRTYHVIRGLSKTHDVTIATLHEGPREQAEALAAALGGQVEVLTAPPSRFRGPVSVLLGALTPVPYHVWRQRSAALRRVIAEAEQRKRFDIGLATMAHLFPYLDALGPEACRIIDTHNVDSMVMARYAASLRGLTAAYARMTARKLRRHEAKVFREAESVLICSELESALVRDIAPGTDPVVVPNGVDGGGAFRPLDRPPDPRRLAFFGRLDYYPNADAAERLIRDLLPPILAEVPGAELLLVGPGAGPSLTALAGTSPAVTITGPVPDIREVIGSAAVVVVPLRMGGGTRLKILEALALARPVVTTPIGAEGLDLEPGKDAILVDDDAGFVHHVVRLMKDPESGRRLGESGRRAVCERYDWSITEARIEDLVSRHSERCIS